MNVLVTIYSYTKITKNLIIVYKVNYYLLTSC